MAAQNFVTTNVKTGRQKHLDGLNALQRHLRIEFCNQVASMVASYLTFLASG